MEALTIEQRADSRRVTSKQSLLRATGARDRSGPKTSDKYVAGRTCSSEELRSSGDTAQFSAECHSLSRCKIASNCWIPRSSTSKGALSTVEDRPTNAFLRSPSQCLTEVFGWMRLLPRQGLILPPPRKSSGHQAYFAGAGRRLPNVLRSSGLACRDSRSPPPSEGWNLTNIRQT